MCSVNGSSKWGVNPKRPVTTPLIPTLKICTFLLKIISRLRRFFFDFFLGIPAAEIVYLSLSIYILRHRSRIVGGRRCTDV